MGKKTYNENEIKDTHGPMNNVSNGDAEVWANAKAGVDYNEKQIKRIALAKKKKAKTSTKKHNRRMSKQIIKNIEKT